MVPFVVAIAARARAGDACTTPAKMHGGTSAARQSWPRGHGGSPDPSRRAAHFRQDRHDTGKQPHRHRRCARLHRRRVDPADRADIRVSNSVRLVARTGWAARRRARCPNTRATCTTTASIMGRWRAERAMPTCWRCRTARPPPVSPASTRRIAGAVIVDLSADFRFDDDWYYGLPELTRVTATTAATDQQPRLLRHRDAAGDRTAEGATACSDRCSASACPAIPAPAPRHRTRTILRSCATT